MASKQELANLLVRQFENGRKLSEIPDPSARFVVIFLAFFFRRRPPKLSFFLFFLCVCGVCVESQVEVCGRLYPTDRSV